MQHITDDKGKPVGVFLSMKEWEAIQQQLKEPGYDEWHRASVQKGLDAFHARQFASQQSINGIFARMGVDAD